MVSIPIYSRVSHSERTKKKPVPVLCIQKDQPFMCICVNKLNLNIYITQEPEVNFFKFDCCSLRGVYLEKAEVFSCSCFQSKYIQNFQEKCLLEKLPCKKVVILWKRNWNITLSRLGMEFEACCSWNNMEYLKLIMGGYIFFQQIWK